MESSQLEERLEYLKRIKAEPWVHWGGLIVTAIVIATMFYARFDQFADTALANQTSIAAHQSQLTTLSAKAVQSEANFTSVSQSLLSVETSLGLLLERMRTHDIEGARREAEIRHNASEIDRLRSEGHSP